MNNMQKFIAQYKATETNLRKLERLWEEIANLIPKGIAFGSDSEYENKCRTFRDILTIMPKIDSKGIDDCLLEYDAIGSLRFEAEELGEFEYKIIVEDNIYSQGKECENYRYRLEKIRRKFVQNSIPELIKLIDMALESLKSFSDENSIQTHVFGTKWDAVSYNASIISELLGAKQPETIEWNNFFRHIRFGTVQDLRDIVNSDWPAVRSYLTTNIYGKDDPVPVEIDDLANLQLSTSPIGEMVTDYLQSLDIPHVYAHWTKASNRCQEDPEGAITAARTLLESICKCMLDELNMPYSDKDDLPNLYKNVSTVLNIAPSQQTEDIFKRILGGCTTAVEGLGALRNRLSDAHGHGKNAEKPDPRHAELAVNLAGAMATFLVGTFDEKKRNS